jgi:hypothetical protein
MFSNAVHMHLYQRYSKVFELPGRFNPLVVVKCPGMVYMTRLPNCTAGFKEDTVFQQHEFFVMTATPSSSFLRICMQTMCRYCYLCNKLTLH